MNLQELGKAIQVKREESGLPIEEIAAKIKVSARILRAIEEGSVDSLPHAVYTKGFIRSFALEVGFDPDALQAAIEEAFPPEVFEDVRAETSTFYKPVPAQGIGRKIGLIALFVLLLAAFIAGGWYIATTYGSTITEWVKKPFSAVSPTDDRSTYAVAVIAEQSQRVDNTVQDIPEVISVQADQAVYRSDGPAIPSSLSAVDSPAYAGVVLSTELQHNSTARKVVIAANDTCYLGISTDKGRLKHLMMQPNETLAFDFSSSLRLVVGNAGGIRVFYDGKDLGSIGPKDKRVELQFPY